MIYNQIYIKKYANMAMVFYAIALLVISVYFSSYSLQLQWVMFGAVEVFGFFYFSQQLSSRWLSLSERVFEKRLLGLSLILRLLWMSFSYIYYMAQTGQPYEFDAMDSINYHDRALWILEMFQTNNLKEYMTFLTEETDDAGYASYLAFLYFISDESIIFVRIFKSLWSALTVLLIYRLSKREFGIEMARVAGIICMMMPNLIYYCGLNLKETEMVFLCVLFVERADNMLRSHKFTTWEVFPILAIAGALFTLRTPLGIVAILSLLFSIIMSSTRVVSWGKRVAVGTMAGLLVMTMMGNRIEEQAQELYEQASGGIQQQNMEWRSKRKDGNEFAKYAGAAVFAPMILTIPFPTMVETPGQENQKIIHGGNFIKNILSYFTILAVVMLIITGDWRNHLLPLSFMGGYVAVLVFSHFAQSERFHMPALTFELMFAAYGMMVARSKPIFKRSYIAWCMLMLVACVAWSWFKLAGRGMA